MQAFGKRLLLIDVPEGKSEVIVSETAAGSLRAAAYANPRQDVWREATERFTYGNLSHRTYTEAGMSCLGLKEITPVGGWLAYPVYPNPEASGLGFKLKGENSGGKVAFQLTAGDLWKWEIRDDFVGWREFNVYRESMSTAGAEKKWGVTTRVEFDFFPTAAGEMSVADIHLLPAREGDFVKTVEAKRRLTALKTSSAPAIDGLSADACWSDAQVAADFHAFGRPGLSDSKTNVRVCYDDANLYVFFDALEPIDNLGTPLARDSEIWSKNHVEVFVRPDRNKADWYQFLVDPAGTVWDIAYNTIGRDYGWNGDLELKTALNWKASWTLELRIPFKTLGKAPKKGDAWGISFGRMDMTGEFSNWATTGEWCDPDGFGEIEFE